MNFPLEKIKENKAFNFHESIDEIFQEIIPLINKGNIYLIEESNNLIKINFDLPLKKFNKIEFKIEKKERTESEQITELYNIAIRQNKEINDLKKDIIDLKKINKELENIRNKIENLENENKKILEIKKFNENVIMKNNSLIFESVNTIDFIITQINNQQKFKNRKLILNQGTKNGKRSSDFHDKCDKKPQLLFFIQTIKGEIFGGYTEVGYGRSEYDRDDKAFLFSLRDKKIYKSQKEKDIIYNNRQYGPSFYDVFYINSNMFEDGGYLESKSYCQNRLEGISSEYEFNNGEKNFYLQEIEAYQILFQMKTE